MTVAEMRSRLRIKHQQLDVEIDSNMAAWEEDMRRVGISIEDANSPLLDKACELYVKAQMNFQDKGDEYLKKYDALRDSMSLSQLYT